MSVADFNISIAIGGILLMFSGFATLLAGWFKWSEPGTKLGVGIALVIVSIIWLLLPVAK
jgi:hypothetical protein